MPKPETSTFYQVTHYRQSDPKCNQDYCSIDFLDARGNVIKEYSDYYHHHGQDEIVGFINGVRWALGTSVNLIKVDLSDIEDEG